MAGEFALLTTIAASSFNANDSCVGAPAALFTASQIGMGLWTNSACEPRRGKVS